MAEIPSVGNVSLAIENLHIYVLSTLIFKVCIERKIIMLSEAVL